jgi:secondary thiamine-phosphate synthase enzyme
MPTSLTISSKKRKQVIDITDDVQKALEDKYKSGLCHVFALHTTAAITTADLDPGTDLDMLDAFEAIVPHLKYRHPHNPAHAPDHIMSSIIGPDTLVPVRGGKLVLGTWQRIVLVELDGPRERDVVVTLIGE